MKIQIGFFKGFLACLTVVVLTSGCANQKTWVYHSNNYAGVTADYRQDAGDYAVKGKIISTKYVGRLISYGLSVYGPDLWFIGFPACWTQNNLSVELALVDAKDQKTIFSKTYTAAPRQGCSWIYDLKDDFNYPEMLAELNKQFCSDIQPFLVAAPKAQ
jgi:hypothetical protein